MYTRADGKNYSFNIYISAECERSLLAVFINFARLCALCKDNKETIYARGNGRYVTIVRESGYNVRDWPRPAILYDPFVCVLRRE